jgi:hypothetical protein
MGSICSDFNSSLIAMFALFALKATAKNTQKNIFQDLGPVDVHFNRMTVAAQNKKYPS